MNTTSFSPGRTDPSDQVSTAPGAFQGYFGWGAVGERAVERVSVYSGVDAVA